MKKTLIIIGLIFTALITLDLPGISVVDLKFVDALERQAYDVRVNLSAKDELDNRVVIIDIDERSLQVEGQWIWPREKFANLVTKLFDNYNIDTLGFDITFPEPEDRYKDAKVEELVSEATDAASLLEKLRSYSGDLLFANAMSGRSVVLGSVFDHIASEKALIPNFGVPPEPVFLNSGIDYQRIVDLTNAPEALRYTSNTSILAEGAAATGFFSISEKIGDPDGIIRRVDLLNKYNNKLYPSLALQVIQTYLFDEVQPVLVEESIGEYASLEAIQTMLSKVPIDERASINVPYNMPGKTYEYIPATDILSDAYAGDITGAIALIGASASGLVDLRNTPVATGLPGVEVHANVISAFLDEKFRTKPGWVLAADFIVVVFVGILLSCLLPNLSALWSSLVFTAFACALMAGNWYFWSDRLIILSLAPALTLTVFLYMLNMVAGFFSESQARRVTQKMFGLYVPPEVVTEMSATEDIFSLKSQKRELTVFFCDIRNFTTISESMEPEVLSEWLNDFLTPMTKIIHKHGGAIDKYMGDAIMAFWGAPLEDPNHAENGIKAAVEMIDYLDTLNEESREKGWPEINIGAGLNTGMMSVGNMGSEFRMAYTVLGDAVNLGARLESMTKEYKVSIIVSEFTKAAAPDFKYDYLDNVKVKGKNEAVQIYTVDGELARQDHMVDNVVSVKQSV